MTPRTGYLPALCAALALAAMAGPARATISTGAAAPAFQLHAAGGSPVSLASLKGQVVLINFWASWCGPCRTEMPILEQLYRKYEPAGFTLLGVNVEPDPKDAQAFLKSTPVTFPILFDASGQVSKLYDVIGMPSTVIIDRTGHVSYIHHGYKPGDEGQYLDQIRKLIQQ